MSSFALAAGSLVPLGKGSVLRELKAKEGTERLERVDLKNGDHLWIAAEPRARLTVMVRIGESADARYAMEVHAADESSVTVICLQEGGKNMVIRQKGRVGAGASIRWQNANVGGANVTHELASHLVGGHGDSTVDWVFHARGSEQLTISARNVFENRDGGGEITLKGVAEGKATISCDGMIEITEQGRGTDTYLTEDVLMLDKTARVDAVPGLEIRTNDVKASHSATISQVTAEDLFYFQSRGIDQAQARTMYVEGFLGDLTNRITDVDIRQEVQTALIAAPLTARSN